MVLTNVEVVNSPLDYNIMLGQRFVYAMKFMAFYVFHIMMFPHEGKVVTIERLTYYKS